MTMTRVQACPDHTPEAGIAVPDDDAKRTCTVCGTTGYHVQPFDMPPMVLLGWTKWHKVEL